MHVTVVSTVPVIKKHCALRASLVVDFWRWFHGRCWPDNVTDTTSDVRESCL